MTKKRRRHTPEQIIKKLRDADAMLAAGKSLGEVLQALEISEPTLSRWRSKRHAPTRADEILCVPFHFWPNWKTELRGGDHGVSFCLVGLLKL